MYGCGEQKVGVASGSGWNLWVWLLGVVVRRYIDFLILLIPTPLVSVLFCSSIIIYREDFAQQYDKCGARSGSSQQEHTNIGERIHNNIFYIYYNV